MLFNELLIYQKKCSRCLKYLVLISTYQKNYLVLISHRQIAVAFGNLESPSSSLSVISFSLFLFSPSCWHV